MDAHFVIVGLGNPGKQYEKTRHNMGFMVVQAFAEKYQIPLKEEKRFLGFAGKGILDGATIHLLLPTTYMNLSGQAVRKLCDFYKLGPESLLVVCDDMDLPFGKMRVRVQGSAGGHNGLKSVEAHMGTRHYARLRMGIGRSEFTDVIDHVLERFNQQESEQLESFVSQGADVLELLPKMSYSDLMTRVNERVNKRGETNESKR